MSLPVPSIFDGTNNWIRNLKRRLRPPLIRLDKKTHAGYFSNAQKFTVTGSQFIIANEMTQINQIPNVIITREAVFELLRPNTCLDATKDSSARYPPPRCHPKTRLKIRESLMRWLLREYSEWKMMWVRGAAGTGKSAVAQTFGDSCEEEKRHGASYFFSRVANRNKLEGVIPTLVFQLATTVPEYQYLIGHQLANNPLLLRQSPPIQFRQLIIEPFTTLQRQSPQKPIVIILDGLDECEREDDQRKILEMITNAVRSIPELPLRWLIFSRPEAHLKNIFSRNLLCGREELIIDAECRENVERYVKCRLAEIKDAYNDVTPPDWPLPNRLQELFDAVSGLFTFASTCLNYIADPEQADPPSQLDSLLTFMRLSQGVVSRNPLAALDLLYSRILEKIPRTVYETTGQILAYMSHRDKLDIFKELKSAQALGNFLRLDRHAFYKAVRGLHSVMSIPEQEDAGKSQLQFYHASFQDFLLDPNRSGKFVISEQDALMYIIPSYTYWYEVDVMYFHINEGWDFDHDHQHDSLPGLTWVSEDNQSLISRSITTNLEYTFFYFPHPVSQNFACKDLSSLLLNIDFRYWQGRIMLTLTYLCQLNPSTLFVRIEPSSYMDYRLLEYFYLVINNGIAKPATFPLRLELPDNGEWIREYFVIGHGVRSGIVWRTKSPRSQLQYTYSLRCDQEPSEAQILEYQGYLLKIQWEEAKAKLEMK